MNAPVLQLHGILPAASPRLRSRHPHRMLQLGALTALVSRCPFDGNLDAIDPAGLSDRVLAHHELLLAYSADHVLLPTRFGAFFSSIDAVRQALGADEETHLAGLAHLTHRREYNVRLSISAQPLGGADAPAQQATGAQFLSQRRQARDKRQTARQDRTDFARWLAQALQGIAEVTSFGSREALLDLTMLLTQEERLELQALLKEQGPRAEQFGLLLEASGPWPAYSFNASPGREVAFNGC
ncbi:GvpL/GvpF family gas vesicle protein [uncultured Sulfitobacter sp.]|uniref:GvpL/GvpF family gas vesicle protein n=1 Tax=uncultured Sulfitobacter sp. TaxID=191468 RepID=UPI00262A8601|nr:GvpL/GvpF family gas vesicle protein [uncultured Sulfitobacter sp.]